MISRPAAVGAILLLLGGCIAVRSEERIDNVPMYGQPALSRPEFAKKADEWFIRNAIAGFGSREAASKAWHARAEEYMNQGNLDYAMRRYNQSWLLNPTSYLPYWGFGRVMLERDKLDEAIVYFEKAKELIEDPYQKPALLSDAGSAYSNRAYRRPPGETQDKRRDFELANREFIESTTLDPTYGRAWQHWAFSLYREGRYSEAWEKVGKARALSIQFTSTFLKNLGDKMPEPR